jgi:hypothetical protein
MLLSNEASDKERQIVFSEGIFALLQSKEATGFAFSGKRLRMRIVSSYERKAN